MLATPSLKRDLGCPLDPKLIPRTPPRDGETTEANRRMRSPRFPIRMFPSSRDPSRFRDPLPVGMDGHAAPKRLNAYLAKLLPRWVDPRGDRRLRKPRCSAAVTIGFPFYISLWDSARRPLRTVKSPRLSLRRVGAKCTLSFFPSRRGNRWYTAN